MDARTLHWQFVQASGNGRKWKWCRVSADGTVQTGSYAINGFGKAVSDAMKNGFNPQQEHWSVVGPTGITHYAPAEAGDASPASPT